MANRKGVKHYPEELKRQIREEYESGNTMKSLSQKYGVSRYSVQSWCGLRPEVNRRQQYPMKMGRPKTKEENNEAKIKRLEMENELLRNFLRELERM